MASLPDKSALRRDCLERRLAIAADDNEAWSAQCCLAICRIVEALPLSRKVAGYMPIQAEVDVMGALLRLHQGNYPVCLPVTEGGNMHFRSWHSGIGMEEGSFGILYPSRAHDMAPVVPDILIVPVLGFDRRLHRLGYGKGYYDRALEALRAQNPQLLAIGAAFSLQEVPELPAEPHDAALDIVVTEKETLRP